MKSQSDGFNQERYAAIDMDKEKEFLDFLLERFKIEREKFDRSGVYAYTQRLLAYNSNKIEGSTLTYA